MSSSDLLQIMLLWLCALFNIVAGIYIFVGQKINTKRSALMMEFLAAATVYVLAETGAIYGTGNGSASGLLMARVSYFLVFIVHYILALLVMKYIECFVDKENARMNNGWKALLYLLSFLGIGLVIVSQFTGWLYYFDENNAYQRGPLFWIVGVLTACLLAAMLLITLSHIRYMKKLEYMPVMLLEILPMITVVIQLFYSRLALNTIGIGVSTIIMFICYEVERSNKLMEQEHLLIQQELEMERNQKLVAEQQKELTEQRTQIMLSQIQPHFMYNTLASIEAMCEIDPPKARKAIHTFSRYLRMNMGNLEGVAMVPFSKELEYVDTYVWIEMMRFQERLNVEYDLKVKHFEVPSLTLQPIVENAVKHGVCALPEGGTVRISSWEEEEYYVIQVKDNGEGFDMDAIQNDGKLHIGLKNVRERLQGLCNGKLDVESKIGEGTVVQIRIPIIKESFSEEMGQE